MTDSICVWYRLPTGDDLSEGHGYNADLRSDQRVNCGLNLRTRSAVYPLVAPQVRIIVVNKIRLWVISGCADVATGKRRIKSAGAKCGDQELPACSRITAF